MSIIISGRVQGVGFRASAWEKARALDLKGFVKNNPDGTVSIEAEGEGKPLDALVEWCKKGPSSARVKYVEVSESALKFYRAFEIAH